MTGLLSPHTKYERLFQFVQKYELLLSLILDPKCYISNERARGPDSEKVSVSVRLSVCVHFSISLLLLQF